MTHILLIKEKCNFQELLPFVRVRQYCCTKSMAIAPFWFSNEQSLTALMPFWFSANGVQYFYQYRAKIRCASTKNINVQCILHSKQNLGPVA